MSEFLITVHDHSKEELIRACIYRGANDFCVGEEYGEQQHLHCHIWLQYEDNRPYDHERAYWNTNYKANVQTVKNHKAALEYCKKDGEYYHKNEVLPIDVRSDATWRAWQNAVVQRGNNPREIICVIDQRGGTGKTYMARWFTARHKAVMVPAFSYKEIMGTVIDFKSKLYFIDIPRGLSGRKLHEVWAAIESIKDGYAADPRYKGRIELFDPPKIVVFTNWEPSEGLMSADRWWFVRPEDY